MFGNFLTNSSVWHGHMGCSQAQTKNEQEGASTHKSAKTHAGNVFVTRVIAQRPASVAEWLTHSAAMCSRAWRAQWPRFAPQTGSVRLSKNYHRLRGSASPVLTATGFVNGKGQFSTPPQNRHPSTDHQKNCHRWLRRRPLRLCQIRCISVHGGLLGTWVKYNQNYFYLCPLF